MDDLLDSGATALARRIRGREVSAAEVVDAHLRRIEAVNPQLNAVVQLRAEGARRDADAADRALAVGGDIGPLHGVPFTIKDSFETAGIVSTSGTTGRRDYVPDRDSTVVTRLREAGAILLAKTNVPEAALADETDNLVYGRTNNPFDTSRTPGGSSGGEAAIIAAGGSPLGIGSDAEGSIRNPAHYCGITGLKPTAGRVPRTGHWPPATGTLDGLVQVGPMARRVEDLYPALVAISGEDGIDPSAVPAPLGDPPAVDAGELRVAWFTDNGIADPTPGAASAVRDAAGTLDHDAVEARPPGVEHALELQLPILGADGGKGLRRLLRDAGTKRIHQVLQDTLDLLQASPPTADELAAALVRWTEFRAEMLAFMSDYDVLVCPVADRPAPKQGGVRAEQYSYLFPFNHIGWPVVVVRAGTSPESLPIGVQVIARPWREDIALAAAARIEEKLGGWRPPQDRK